VRVSREVMEEYRSGKGMRLFFFKCGSIPFLDPLQMRKKMCSIETIPENLKKF